MANDLSMFHPDHQQVIENIPSAPHNSTIDEIFYNENITISTNQHIRLLQEITYNPYYFIDRQGSLSPISIDSSPHFEYPALPSQSEIQTEIQTTSDDFWFYSDDELNDDEINSLLEPICDSNANDFICLSKNNLLRFEVFNINNEENNSEHSCHHCSICHDDFEDNDRIIVFDCTENHEHYFHRDCILKWLEKKISCPLCRTKILNHHIPKWIYSHKYNIRILKEIKQLELNQTKLDFIIKINKYLPILQIQKNNTHLKYVYNIHIPHNYPMSRPKVDVYLLSDNNVETNNTLENLHIDLINNLIDFSNSIQWNPTILLQNFIQSIFNYF